MTANYNINLLKKIEQLVNKFSDSNSEKFDKEMKWLLLNCNSEYLKKIIPNLTVLSLHIIESISENEPVNCTRISEYTLIPKGTVSKITKKLINLNLISVKTLENNKKEKLYLTTERGKELAILHRKLHFQHEEKLKEFIKMHSEMELEVIIKFIDDFIKFYF